MQLVVSISSGLRKRVNIAVNWFGVRQVAITLCYIHTLDDITHCHTLCLILQIGRINMLTVYTDASENIRTLAEAFYE